MKFAIFGLTVSSSWGNGHATLWRGLIRALSQAGHQVTFFERDTPYYAETRDLDRLPGSSRLILYADWQEVAEEARKIVAASDVAMVTSYCADGVAAADLILERGPGLTVFYDLDTPVTLAQLDAGHAPSYLPPQGLGDFDLVLSYTGGTALTRLRTMLGARQVAPLYGHVDPDLHRPAERQEVFAADLSYLGTYATDRQAALQTLFVEPAQCLPGLRFVLGGSGYPDDFPWTSNIYFVKHVPPADHSAFFSSARITLNVTRGDMVAMGYCPSGRLFEAAACGVPVMSDWWEGLDDFFEPEREILVARTTVQAVRALSLPSGDLAEIATAARNRVLAEHKSSDRARYLVELLRTLGRPGATVDGRKMSEADNIGA